MNATLPSLYLSHGSPMIALESSPAATFLDRLGPAIDATWGRPRAVVIVSPHTVTREPVVQAAARHTAVHDFGGFPPPLYQLRYDAPGEPVVAAQVVQLLQEAGLQAHLDEPPWPDRPLASGSLPVGGAAPQRGPAGQSGRMDHGIWTVLRRAWPAADVPVVPVSLVADWDARRQWALGQALAPLRSRGVLVIGSGSLTHNLRRFFSTQPTADAPVAADVQAFREWVQQRSLARDWAALLDWSVAAPAAHQQHPTDEHWLPFYIAAGAGGQEVVPQRIHASVDAGLLAMDAYCFGVAAEPLMAALQRPPRRS